MERLTIPDVRIDQNTIRRSIIDAEKVKECAMKIYWRLKSIEDAVADAESEEYDLDRLRELVEADQDGRCVVFQPGHPVVSEYYKEGDFCIREATGVISKKEYMARLKGEQDGTH